MVNEFGVSPLLGPGSKVHPPVGAGVKRPVVNEAGAVEVATVMTMTMTLSVDHRVIDGALGAQFLQAIVDNLECLMAMLA